MTPGNVTDTAPYLGRIEHMKEYIGLKIEAVCADSAYNVNLVHQELEEQGIRFIAPINKESPRYKAEFKRGDFTYDAVADVFICPQGKRLKVKQLQWFENNVAREYRAEIKDCQNCPLHGKCLSPSHACRRIQVNIFEDAVKRNHAGDGTLEHQRILNLRQVWCEGRFAAQKARHNLRRLFRQGLEAAESHCLLSATAMNLKRMVKCMG